MAEYVLASPVVSAFILVGLRYVYTIYYFKSKRGFDSSADLAGVCRRDDCLSHEIFYYDANLDVQLFAGCTRASVGWPWWDPSTAAYFQSCCSTCESLA